VLGARPVFVSCSTRELEDADSLVNNVDDVRAKASQIFTATLWHSEASVWENQWRQDKGWFMSSHTFETFGNISWAVCEESFGGYCL